MTTNPSLIEVLPYNSQWPEIYETASKTLATALGSYLKRIYHIGSTAVPKLSAKPIIDMLLVLETLDDGPTVEQLLNSLKYSPFGKMIILHRSFLSTKQDHDVGFNLHIYERGDPQINRHVNFRSYLRAHQKEALEYQQLKTDLAQTALSRYDYVLGKDTLVQSLDRKAKIWAAKQGTDYLSPNTGPKASLWSQEKVLKCMEANWNVHLTHFAQYIDSITLRRIPDYTAIHSHLQDDTFNVVLRADFDEKVSSQVVDQVRGLYSSKHTPFTWWLCDTDVPKNLDTILEQQGFKSIENNTSMFLDLDLWQPSPLPSNLKIIRAQDEQTLNDFAMVLYNDKDAFNSYFKEVAQVMTEDDPIEYYVGYVNGKPVVRGLSCYYAQTVGLHWLSTCPNERRKGYGTAMQQYRLERAQSLGYSIAVLQASHEGRSLYEKLGYKECGIYREFKVF